LSLIRASAAVKRQSTARPAALRLACQAATSRAKVSLSPIRRSRHCVARTPSSIYAMSSQLPCLGVWWISRRAASRRASSGAKAWYSEADVCVLRLSMISTTVSASG